MRTGNAVRRAGDRHSAPRWRAVLEARWRIRLQEVTELSVAYHAAAAGSAAAAGDPQARQLLGRAVAARQRLADTEDALGRLAAGGFGRCEQCMGPISGKLLTAVPESRYCASCACSAAGAVPALASTPAPAGRR